MSARAWMLFAAVSVIWGMPYLFIKIAVDELSPSVVAWSRLAIAAVVLLPLAWRLGALRGLAARWRTLHRVRGGRDGDPVAAARVRRAARELSLAAILIAAVPLFVALLALRFDHAERPTATRLAGMLIGLAGVAALVGIDLGGEARRAARRGGDPPRRVLLRDRADDREAPALGRGSAGPVAASLGIADAARHARSRWPTCPTRRRPPTRSPRSSCSACSARRWRSCSSSA